MNKRIRVIHYLNQFFGGIGGEDKADAEPMLVMGVVGPGRAINQMLGERGEVVGSVICGDNYFTERPSEALKRIMELTLSLKPDLVLAGPAFNAGRYGPACGDICKTVQAELGIPAVTGMHEENPGVDLFRESVFIVRTEDSVRGMNDAVTRMVNLGLKLLHKQTIGSAEQEGYFSRGIIKNEFVEKNAASRAVDMVLAKVSGKSFIPELELPKFDRVPPALLHKELSSATIALATDCGIVPKGNPDRMESNRSIRFATYSVEGMATLRPEAFEANHMGFDTELVNQDPNRMVPLDVLREMEKEGLIGKVHDKIYTTAGVATSLYNARKIADGIVESMKAEGVDAVILTSAWGTSTRCGAVITKELERNGLPTSQIATMTPIAMMVGANRVVPGAGIVHPVGNADLDRNEEKRLRRAIVMSALKAIQSKIQSQVLFERVS